MPLPSSTIGANNFNPIVAGQLAQNNQSEFLVNNLSNLGQSISDSISINNMRKEAQQVAPQLQQAYNEGFQAIQDGHIGHGLSQIAGINASYASNPILAKIGAEAQQSAGILAHGRIQEAAIGQRGLIQGKITEAKNKNKIEVQGMKGEQQVTHDATMQGGWDERQQKDIEARQSRLQQILDSKETAADKKAEVQRELVVLRSMMQQKTNDPVTAVNRELKAQKSYHEQIDALNKQKEDAQAQNDQGKWKDAQAQINQLNATMVQHGFEGQKNGGPPFLNEDEKKRIEDLKEKAEKALEQNGIENWWNGDGKTLNEQYQKEIEGILSKASEGLKERAVTAQGMSAKSQPPAKQVPSISQSAIKALRDNPDKADQFDAKYGKGAADSVLSQ